MGNSYPEWVEIKSRRGRLVRFRRHEVISLRDNSDIDGKYTEASLSNGQVLRLRRITDEEARRIAGQLIEFYEEDESDE